MQRHIKAHSDGKVSQVVSPGTMRFLDFARLQFARNEKHAGTTGGREYVLDVFAGGGRVTVDGAGKRRTFEPVGGRADVFSGPPAMVYLPPNCSYEITALTDRFDPGPVFPAAHAASQP